MRKQSVTKKGFSLMEVVIAMAVISIVFTIAMTAVTAASKSRLRAYQGKYCISEVSNLLECYKLDGGKDFANNVQKYLGVTLISEGTKNDEGGAYTEYVIYYDVDFAKLETNAQTEESRVYKLTAKVYQNAFSANIIKINTNSLLFEIQRYQSRYDLVYGQVGGGV